MTNPDAGLAGTRKPARCERHPLHSVRPNGCPLCAGFPDGKLLLAGRLEGAAVTVRNGLVGLDREGIARLFWEAADALRTPASPPEVRTAPEPSQPEPTVQDAERESWSSVVSGIIARWLTERPSSPEDIDAFHFREGERLALLRATPTATWQQEAPIVVNVDDDLIWEPGAISYPADDDLEAERLHRRMRAWFRAGPVEIRPLPPAPRAAPDREEGE